MNTTDVVVPDEQSDGTRSQVSRWLKSIGDSVTHNEPLVEIETDKVTVEIPAPIAGTLVEILADTGASLEPGDVIARIATSSSLQLETQGQPPVRPLTPSIPEGAQKPLMPVNRAATFGSSPAVKRLLAEHGLAEEQMVGSGPAGRITIDDVLAKSVAPTSSCRTELAQHPDGANTVVSGTVPPSGHRLASEAQRRVLHSPIRRRTAARMIESLLHTAPHVTTVFEADMTAVLRHRADYQEEFSSRGAPLTLTPYFISASTAALAEVPEANARWTDEALLLNDEMHIAVATALPRGLVAPVLRGVQRLDLFAIARALNDLVTRARDDQLTASDMQGGTFTISNHGVSGSLVASPIIINQPQSAILGIGRLEKRPIVISRPDGVDEIVAQPRCYVTLTIDHRVMDGHQANQFLRVLVERLESWPRDPAS